ncbi:MAG: preprotein translocase subunit YajC [Wolbachia endosymbiont of Tyrophagus putrescentiae]|nr:preprotein translocase subunit YajC [Wolbachia endosymbiont of Tyrophagus putrescentiae]
MFFSEALAASSNNSASTSLVGFVPFVLVILVFYFMIIRPHQKRLKEHKNMIDLIKRGDVVVTAGGIVGEVSKVDEANEQFIIEIAPKVEVKVLKSTISQVLTQKTAVEKNKTDKQNKDRPAANEKKKDNESKDEK